eukprot:5113_1
MFPRYDKDAVFKANTLLNNFEKSKVKEKIVVKKRKNKESRSYPKERSYWWRRGGVPKRDQWAIEDGFVFQQVLLHGLSSWAALQENSHRYHVQRSQSEEGSSFISFLCLWRTT